MAKSVKIQLAKIKLDDIPSETVKCWKEIFNKLVY